MKSAFLVLKFTFLLLFSESIIEMSKERDQSISNFIRQQFYGHPHGSMSNSAYEALRGQVYGDPYGNGNGSNYPSNQENATNKPPANLSQATSKKRKMQQNNTSNFPQTTSKTRKIHSFLRRPLSSIPKTTSDEEIIIFKFENFDVSNINKLKKSYLKSQNHGFKLTFQGPNQEDTDSYEIVQGKDGKKRWKTVPTGGKRHTRSSRKKRSKRTVRKQRK